MPVEIQTGSFLRGVRVLELADEVGEYCGKLLAGLGADVIKVEPLGGERSREIGPFYRDDPHPDRSLYFWHFNFGKRGIVLDLDEPEDQGRFRQLADTVDVIIDTRPPRYLEDRAIGYQHLCASNPGLVYARITPFGEDGPWAGYQGTDLIHLALGGVMMNCGYDPTPDGDYDTPPVAPQMWQSYQIAGEQAVIGILGALCHQLETGSGQKVSISVHQAVSVNTETDVPDWVYARRPHGRLTCRHSFPVLRDGSGGAPTGSRLALTKDGRWVLPYSTYLSGKAGTSGRTLTVEFLRKHGITFREDEKFNDAAYLAGPDAKEQIDMAIERLIHSHKADRDLWQEAQEAGQAWAPVRRPEENLTDEHWAQRETFVEVQYPELRETFLQGRAKWFAPELPWRSGPRAPLLGEHTESVFKDLAAAKAERDRRPRVEFKNHADTLVRGPSGKDFLLPGVRVVDLAWILASAGGSRFFAAMGAEVIKVEHESRLDSMRFSRTAPVPDGLRQERDQATGPLSPSPTDLSNRSGTFNEINAGKRALSLNLKDPRGREILLELIRDADVLIEGFSPGTMERMGLGWDRLRQINPQLVYVQQSGFGEHGSYGRLRSYGPTAAAFSGISDMSGLPDPYPPAGIGYSYLDWFGAYQMATAMLAGLWRQRSTGKGCYIDSSQGEAGLYLTGTALLDYTVNGRPWRRTGNQSPYRPAAPSGAYRAAGRDNWIAIQAFDSGQWVSLIRVLNVRHWANDPRLATFELRMRNLEYLDSLLNSATREWDRFELMERLQEVGVPAGVCQTAEDRCERDPQLKHLAWQIELTHTEIGAWRVKELPMTFSKTPAHIGGRLNRHAPNYGEDNDYVLGDILGLDPEEIAVMRDQGVL